MAKFQFRLEPVLRQRAAKEVSAEQALALAHHEFNRQVNLLEESRRRLESALTAGEEEKLEVFEVIHLSYYRASLSNRIDSQEQDVQTAGLTLNHKRDEAVQARQERQVIEKLKDKHLQACKKEESVREQKEVDELALYAYQRRREQLQRDLASSH